jgi:uncharacterized BrkB/YihY/UPF0761 family membrane protein
MGDGSAVRTLRVSSARIDELAGAAAAFASGVTGFVAAVLSGEASLTLGALIFAAAVSYGAFQALRRWRENIWDQHQSYEPLPPSAVVRPAWVASAWIFPTALVICGACVALSVSTRWGVLGAGGLFALGTGPFLTWLRLRRWEREHAASVYYERMPLLTGGVSRRYVVQQNDG